jgi:hypothetical protein
MYLLLIYFHLNIFVSPIWGAEELRETSSRSMSQPLSAKGATAVTQLNKENLTNNTTFIPHTQPDLKKIEDTSPIFPAKEIELYEACGGKFIYKSKWILTSRGTMQRLADCAKAGDPIATLYLAHAFDQTHSQLGVCLYTRKLYERAFKGLQDAATQIEDLQLAAKARFMIASNQFQASCYLLPEDDLTTGEVEFCSQYLNGLTTREAILLTNFIRLKEKIDPIPTIDDFLHEEDLKEHPRIFLKALGFMNLPIETHIRALETAIQKHEHPAFLMRYADIWKARYERRKDPQDRQKEIQLLERAGELGQPYVYLTLCSYIVRFFEDTKTLDFRKASLEDIERCRQYLEKAKAQHLPAASYNLALRAQEMYERTPRENDAERVRWGEENCEHHKQAARLGFWRSYYVLQTGLPRNDPFFTEVLPFDKERKRLYWHVMKPQ